MFPLLVIQGTFKPHLNNFCSNNFCGHEVLNVNLNPLGSCFDKRAWPSGMCALSQPRGRGFKSCYQKKKNKLLTSRDTMCQTYLTSTGTICCSMREKERNIRTNFRRPFLKFLFSGNTTAELICCPQCSCGIATSTTKTSTSRNFLVKVNLHAVKIVCKLVHNFRKIII